MNRCFRQTIQWLGIAGCFFSVVARGPAAANLSLVPGEVLYYTPSPSPLDQLFGNEKYTSDPEIKVLPNGWYLACHNTFGGGGDSTTVYLYRSTNKGTNWTALGSVGGLSAGGSLLLHDGAIYLMGSTYILKSTDNGTTWSSPVATNSGKFTSPGPATPNNPVVFNGRWWSSATRRVLSAPVDSNLLDSASWKWSTDAGTSTNWLDGRFVEMTEGQIVASAEQGVVSLPKVRALPYAALIRANPNTGTITFSPDYDFVELPGCEKKFGATYDPVSGKFYVLSNPVLPIHANDPNWGDTPELIRNTTAVFTSRDLYNWKAEKIFLYTPNIDYEAFQYCNFDFDGANMVIASRTAFDVNDTYKPPRGHDSNLITYHRIDNFRNLVPTHVLQLDTANNRVLRFETTQHSNAPLGNFTLGSAFAGTNLTSPNGFMQDTNSGSVYIRETGGRILRFDTAGNFLEVAAAAPGAFKTSGLLAVSQPPEGECTWSRYNSGEWNEPTNWFYWGRADTATETAVFGSAATASATVTLRSACPEWNFSTNGDIEGWTPNIGWSGATVAGGVFTGVVTNTDPQLNRADQEFWGTRFPEVRVRMRADVTNTVFELYWGTAVSNVVTSGTRKVTATYTGRGEFQELVFPTAGHPQWDGNVITRLRLDPLNGTFTGKTVEIDSIKVVPEGFRVKGVRFQSTKTYTLTGSGSGLLRLAPDTGTALVDVQLGSHYIAAPVALNTNTDFDLTNGTTLGISGFISGSGGLNKLGAGILTLNNTNNEYAGDTTISDGTLKLGVAETLPNGSGKGNVTVTGTLNLNGKSETLNGLNGDGIVDGTSGTPTLTVGDNNATSTFSGVIQDTAGTLYLAKIGTGTLTLAGTNTYAGTTTVTGGSLSLAADSALGAVPGAATAGKLVLDGGALAATATFTLNAKRGLTLGTAGGTIDVAGAAVLTYGGIAASAGPLTKTGAGALTLSGVNTYSGDTIVTAGALQLGAANALGGGTLRMNGGQLSSDSATARLLANDVALTATGAEFGDATNTGRLTLAGMVNLGGDIAGTRNITNASKVVISGILTNAAASGTLTLNKYGAGDLVIATNGGNLNLSTTAALIHDGAVIVDNAAVTLANAALQVKGDNAGSLVRLVVTNGGVLLNTNGTGINWRVGVSGGNVAATNIFEIAGMVQGIHSSYAATANRLLLGDGATIGIANLWPGGDLTVRNIQKGGTTAAANSEFNFRGGTLRAFANDAGFISTLTNCYVGSGGGTIDSAGFNVTIPQPLKDGAAVGYGSGGLTKLGLGKLTLSGTNTYSGNTVVSGGTLALVSPAGATSVLSNSPVITVAAGANLDVAGIVSGFRLTVGQMLNGTGSVTGAVTVVSGATVAPGNSIGTLTFSNSPILQGTLLMEINQTNAPANCDQLIVVSKPLTNGGTLTVTNSGPALTGGEVFTLFSAASYSGSFSATNLPPLTTTNLNWWLGNLGVNGSLVVNRAPTATNATYLRARGASLKIPVASLLTNFAGDADGNVVVLQSVGGSGQGATITTNATHITYTPSPGATSNANDSFTYTVNDGRGGSRTANVSITVVPAASSLGIGQSGGSNFTVSFTGLTGYDYVLQRSSNLLQWANVATNTLPLSASNTGLIGFTNAPPHNPAFYRAVLP